MSWRLWVPLLLFAGFLGLAGYMLSRPKSDFVESAMVGEELPYFALPPASADRPGLASADFKDGQPRLLNIWASWCPPCIAEAPQLERLKREGAVIVGAATRDRPEDVARFLARYGNPFAAIGRDDLSEVSMGIGAAGVPETFVIDGRGRITYQHIGEVRADDVPVLLQKLREAGA